MQFRNLQAFAGVALATAMFASPALAGGLVPTIQWPILVDPAVRWVNYPGSSQQLILDRETGLIWEKNPSVTRFDTWQRAMAHCAGAHYTVAGKPVYGFRLPNTAELTNLQRDAFTAFTSIQPSIQHLGVLVNNNYVTNELITVYPPEGTNWDPTYAVMAVQFYSDSAYTSSVDVRGLGSDPSYSLRALCVRGGGSSLTGAMQLQ